MLRSIRKALFGRSEDLGTLDPADLSTNLDQRLVRRLFAKNPQIDKFNTTDTHTVDLNGVAYHFKLSNELLRIRDANEPKQYEILVLPTPEEQEQLGEASVNTKVIQAKGLLKPALGGQLVFDGDKKQVVKISQHGSLSAKSIEEVQREAKIAQQALHEVSQPTIVKGTNAATTYMMMAFLPGENLEKLLNDSQKLSALTVDQRFKMTIDLLRALQEVHDKGIIHRDLKPDNIRYCEKSGKVIIYDFGISKLKNDDRLEENEVLGSIGYAPKEQAIQKRFLLARWKDEITTLQKDTLYVRINSEGGLEYKVLNPQNQEVTGTIAKEKFKSILAKTKKSVDYEELQKAPLDLIKLKRALPELQDALAKEGHALSAQEEARLVHEKRKVDERSDGYSVGKVLSELWEVPHESASVQSEDDRLDLHTLRENDTQFERTPHFDGMDLAEGYKENIIAILEQMTKADREERLSVDDALAQFEQINVQRKGSEKRMENEDVLSAHQAGIETRNALREEMKRTDTNMNAQALVVWDAAQQIIDNPDAVAAFVDSSGLTLLNGSRTIADIKDKLDGVIESKTMLAEKTTQIGEMVNLLSTFGSSSTLLYKILKSISSDLEHANKENNLTQIASIDSLQKHLINYNESISKLHTIYNPDSIDDEKNIGQIMEQILKAPSTDNESLKQLQALVKSGILFYINETYSKSNIKTEKRAASEHRMAQMLDILKTVNEATSIDGLKVALQDQLKTVKNDSYLANIPILKKLAGSQLATHIESAIKMHEIAERRREFQR